jgi:polyisoprenyl-teichoic acid--peptidoglycan teichoic acid transferase
MKKRLRIFLGIAAGLIVIVVVLTIVGYVYYNDAKDYKKAFSEVTNNDKSSDKQNNSIQEKVKTTAAPTEDTQTVTQTLSDEENAKIELKKESIVNILFLGIDRTDERDEWLKVYRSDTIELASINLDTKKVKVLCIPRDTYTFVPIENKMDKVNHAYAYGSSKNKAAEASVDAINHFIKYGTIDYYFTLDMEPIPKVVDSIGGVEVDVEFNMKTHGANLSKGLQLLDGKKAKEYISWRYSGDGDIGRIKRQQKFLKLMYDKLKNTDQMINSLKLLLSYNKYIKTDMSVKQLIALATLSKEIPSSNVEFQIVPGSGKKINKISYWVPDEVKTEALLKNFFSF